MNLQLVYRYVLSLSKNGNLFYEKTTTTTATTTKQTKGPKKESNPGLRDVEGERDVYCATTRHCCLWNFAGRPCLKPVELYLWRTERYIRGKQARFWQLKPYFNSFRGIWRTYDRQVSRKTVPKSPAACDSRRLHEENQLRFSNSKHFHFYWTRNI